MQIKPSGKEINFVLITSNHAHKELIASLCREGKVLFVDMDGTASRALQGEGGTWVDICSSQPLPLLIQQAAYFGHGFDKVIFNTANTLISISRERNPSKAWSRDYLELLILTISFAKSVGNTVWFLHLVPSRLFERLVRSVTVKIYSRLGELWYYGRDKEGGYQLSRISYTTTENRSL